MQFSVPRWLIRGWDAFCDWGNVPLHRFGRYELLRLDIVLVVLGVLCTIYYGWFNGWEGALFGLAAYVMLAIMALVMRR